MPLTLLVSNTSDSTALLGRHWATVALTVERSEHGPPLSKPMAEFDAGVQGERGVV